MHQSKGKLVFDFLKSRCPNFESFFRRLQRESFKYERGGVILFSGEIIELKNIVKDQVEYINSVKHELQKREINIEEAYPEYNFMLDPEDFVKYSNKSICFWHTHTPDTFQASEEDLMFFENTQDYFQKFIIVGGDRIAIYSNIKYTGMNKNTNFGYNYDLELFPNQYTSTKR